jgi:CheY-like chemotaxis protein
MNLKPYYNPTRAVKGAGSRARILYVEDEDVNWDITHAALRDTHELSRAKDALETFTLLRAKRFDLILLDIQLSGSDLSGIQIAQVIKQMPVKQLPAYARLVDVHNLPIIFVTAYTARYTREELLSLGGDDLVAKPVSVTGLSQAISRLLARGASKPFR